MRAYHVELGQNVRDEGGVTHERINPHQLSQVIKRLIQLYLLKSINTITRFPLSMSSPSVGQSD